jgi:hypothetical protein
MFGAAIRITLDREKPLQAPRHRPGAGRQHQNNGVAVSWSGPGTGLQTQRSDHAREGFTAGSSLYSNRARPPTEGFDMQVSKLISALMLISASLMAVLTMLANPL